jgi:hypothetical protein
LSALVREGFELFDFGGRCIRLRVEDPSSGANQSVAFGLNDFLL